MAHISQKIRFRLRGSFRVAFCLDQFSDVMVNTQISDLFSIYDDGNTADLNINQPACFCTPPGNNANGTAFTYIFSQTFSLFQGFRSIYQLIIIIVLQVIFCISKQFSERRVDA